MRHLAKTLLLASCVALPLAGCTNPYDPAQRTVGGAALGAGAGAALGGMAGGGRGALTGALIGGAVGALGGAATTPSPDYDQGQPRYYDDRPPPEYEIVMV